MDFGQIYGQYLEKTQTPQNLWILTENLWIWADLRSKSIKTAKSADIWPKIHRFKVRNPKNHISHSTFKRTTSKQGFH